MHQWSGPTSPCATTNRLGNGLLTLLQHPQAWAQLLADPKLMPGAVDEMLRFESSVNMVPQHVVAPYAIGDTVVPAGGLIFFMTGAADRDPAVVAEPDRFDITRCPNPHLARGAGIHYCVGAPMGRTSTLSGLTMANPCGVAPQLRGKPLRSGWTYATSWDITGSPGHLRVLACGWFGAGQLMIRTWPGSKACSRSTWSTARTAAVS